MFQQPEEKNLHRAEEEMLDNNNKKRRKAWKCIVASENSGW